MINWEELKENNTLEDFYNILCRNKPHRNSKKYKEWDYLESIAYEELLNDNENIKECNEIIDSIIEYLKNDIKTLRDNVDTYDDDFKELVEKYDEKREED